MFQNLRFYMCFIGVVVLLLAPPCSADSTRSNRIKAAIVYYIAKFVRWPTENDSSLHEFRVCYLKPSSFISEVDKILKNKTVRNKSFRLKLLPSSDSSLQDQLRTSCEILLLHKSEIPSYQTFLQDLKDKPILSICTTSSPQWDECAIQIFEEKNRGRIALDRQWVEQSKLVVSSELLSLSIVHPSPRN
ncbi:MAG: YfiR family protein [Bdellovibrionales bacterium]|nr:YfiR family protein [Bdellovibrionales bacterium]